MRIIEENHNSDFDDPAFKPEKITQIKVEGHGVTVTLIEREGGIDVTINPTGQDYMHKVRTHEVYASSAQVRVSSAHGAPL